jgi:hypothetical protein
MAVKDWSTTAASNTGILGGISTDGAVMTVSQTDNAFREMAAQIASQLGKMGFEGADITSASPSLANATGWSVDITGTTAITSFGTVDAGQLFILRFTGALTLTHNATSLILPGAANITTAAGDIALMKSEGSGNWRCISFQRASGIAAVGPASSTDNAVARYNGTGGALQNSGAIVSDNNSIDISVADVVLGYNLNRTGTGAAAGTLRAASGVIEVGSTTDKDVVVLTNGAESARFLAVGDHFVVVGAIEGLGTFASNPAGTIFLRPNGRASSTGQMTVTTGGAVTINGTLTVTG